MARHPRLEQWPADMLAAHAGEAKAMFMVIRDCIRRLSQNPHIASDTICEAECTCHDGAGVVQHVALAQQRHVVCEHAADVRPRAPRVCRPPAPRPVAERLSMRRVRVSARGVLVVSSDDGLFHRRDASRGTSRVASEQYNIRQTALRCLW